MLMVPKGTLIIKKQTIKRLFSVKINVFRCSKSNRTYCTFCHVLKLSNKKPYTEKHAPSICLFGLCISYCNGFHFNG